MQTTARGDFASDRIGVVDLARRLTEANSFDELEGAFRAGAGRVLASPMYGFYALEPDTSRIEHNVRVNVSDVFVARYVQAMDGDPLLAHSRQTGRAVYNRALMSEAEWEESEVFRTAYSLHKMRHVAEVPITADGRTLGALHFGASEPERDYTAEDMQLAEAVAGVLAISIKKIRGQEGFERALEQAVAALDITGAALVVSERLAPELRLNAAAKRLVSEVVNGEEFLPSLLVQRSRGSRFSQRTEVELRSGQAASLHAHSQPLRDGSLVTVLDLKRDHASVDHAQLTSLTPRESQVALLVVEGLSDPEIAEALCLSRYTIHQHVKRIYRALDVDSRVALTRLLLGAPVGARRG